MVRTLIIQPRATFDIRLAVVWLTKHVSAATAAKWQARIFNAAHSLVSKPERCPEADEAAKIGLDLRVLLAGRRPHVYRILFTFDGSTVNVLRVLHAARDHVDADDL